MFTKKTLIKSLNEMYFKDFQSIKGLYPLKFPILENSLNEYITASKITNNKEFILMAMDLMNETPISKLGVSCENIRLDYSHIIKKHIMTNPEIINIRDILISKSLNSYIVGGCIRDILTNKEPKDFDFVTDIPYDEMELLFLSNGYDVNQNGKHFLVLSVSKNGIHYEIANFRKDSELSDGRRPDFVEKGDIFDDAQRRDFTINALYLKLDNFVLADPNGNGINDIENKTLKFVGKPEDRLKEDFLRGWRFIRFIKKGFIPDKKSYKAVKSNWDEIYNNSNPSRVFSEISKMIEFKQ